MSAIRCVRCRRIIEPEENMVAVVVDRVSEWGQPDHVASRLDLSSGKWHYRCVPSNIRQYASAVSAVGPSPKSLVILAAAATVWFLITGLPASPVESADELLAPAAIVEDA